MTVKAFGRRQPGVLSIYLRHKSNARILREYLSAREEINRMPHPSETRSKLITRAGLLRHELKTAGYLV